GVQTCALPISTGSLHLGSLVAAVGSFADARCRGGRWLLRMEDLDAARVIPGCAERMLRMLEAFGLTWDGAVEYQSARTHHYGEALATLEALGLTFQCSCTRAERNADGGYPGTCRNGPKSRGATATRFRVDDRTVCFEDRAQGRCRPARQHALADRAAGGIEAAHPALPPPAAGHGARRREARQGPALRGARSAPLRPGAARGPQAPQPGPSGHAQARATQPGARM